MFYADLHIHSKYSRATSKDLDLEHLTLWARKKGIQVLGTGDFTHPAWMAAIKEKLVPAEPGLFQLREDLHRELEQRYDLPPGPPTRFMLEVEISTIYKKGIKTRKVHHLVYAPDLEKADRIVERLSRIGNLNADGRPILGLDSRDLLEITLEGGPGCSLIPAHVWTPWFSALGSKSGFDAIEDCYGDLSAHIFAIETGLSSDPLMNRMVSSLDRFTLVSNSDAHSPGKIGREASAFDCELGYEPIMQALASGEGYGGTVEFFPEEGKYHMDGCRNCGIRLNPRETEACGASCPGCGKPVTVGVLNRVSELADRDKPKLAPTEPAFSSFIPLPEVLSELEGVGVNSKRVRGAYEDVINSLGSELFILSQAPVDEISKACSPLFGEAIRRMREGEVIRQSGYDGEYGVIRVFEENELKAEKSAGLL
ncbi:MAG: endonuclease Q family protein, partial [Verrucomicrobiota bacterium]